MLGLYSVSAFYQFRRPSSKNSPRPKRLIYGSELKKHCHSSAKVLEFVMDEFRCSVCPPIVRGAMLFKAEGKATIEIKCPKCKQIAVIEVNTAEDEYEAAKEMAKAND